MQNFVLPTRCPSFLSSLVPVIAVATRWNFGFYLHLRLFGRVGAWLVLNADRMGPFCTADVTFRVMPFKKLLIRFMAMERSSDILVKTMSNAWSTLPLKVLLNTLCQKRASPRLVVTSSRCLTILAPKTRETDSSRKVSAQILLLCS